MRTEAKYVDGEICTYTGKWIAPLNPDPSKIDIQDIAHALSNQCRFTGHTREFYSVAQHSVLVSQFCEPADALWGLLHDASEAYLSDIARPIKREPGFGEIYTKCESLLMQAIGTHFNLPSEKPKSVTWADTALLRAEQRDLMPNDGVWENYWKDHEEDQSIISEPIRGWSPRRAKRAFMERYNEIRSGA